MVIKCTVGNHLDHTGLVENVEKVISCPVVGDTGGSTGVDDPADPDNLLGTAGSANVVIATGLPLEITSIKLLDPATIELKFTGAASHPHSLFSDPDLQSGFDDPVAISTGSLTTDTNGMATVTFPFVPGALYFQISD